MGYYLAPSLEVLRAEINTRWPRRDRASDGWIGDPAHQASRSDHNPNSRGSVNALDIDEDGIDVGEVIAAIERHPSTHYWIYERQIADRDDGFRRRPYSGVNPHTKHLHVSIRQGREAEQDRRPWGLLEDDVSAEQVFEHLIPNDYLKGKRVPFETYVRSFNNSLARLEATTREALKTSQAALAVAQGVDTEGIKALIRETSAAEAQRDAELAELVRQGQSGELDATEVLRRMGELLTAGTTPQG